MGNIETPELNQTEKKLLLLLSEGYPLESAAVTLNVSRFSADKYLQNVFGKLDVHSTVAAVAKAIREKMI
jgi:DNA-binding CsgD family transcriptional regulator